MKEIQKKYKGEPAMSDIEFGVVQQPKGNGGKQSETETSTKSAPLGSAIPKHDSGTTIKRSKGE